jgi:hypothetical protein
LLIFYNYRHIVAFIITILDRHISCSDSVVVGVAGAYKTLKFIEMAIMEVKKEIIDDLGSSHTIVFAQTQALVEVLRAYFENRRDSSNGVDVSDSTIVSFLDQLDEKLNSMKNIVTKIIEEAGQTLTT